MCLRVRVPYLLRCRPSLCLLLFRAPPPLPKIGRTFDWHVWEAKLPASCPLLACVYQIALQHSGNWNEGQPRQGQWKGLLGGQSNINVGSVKLSRRKLVMCMRRRSHWDGRSCAPAPPPRHTGWCVGMYTAPSQATARGAFHGIIETCLLRSILLYLHST